MSANRGCDMFINTSAMVTDGVGSVRCFSFRLGELGADNNSNNKTIDYSVRNDNITAYVWGVSTHVLKADLVQQA